MKNLLLISIFFFCSFKLSAQVSCSDAVDQLQSYAAQVNQFYQNEYWQIIPNQRCPAVDAWGRPFNPQVVQNCRWQMLTYLNQWYGIQCQNVNNWYVQIVRGCSTSQPSRIERPAPTANRGGDESESISTGEIEDLTAGIDEDKAIPIRIPTTPAGYNPRN